MVDQRSLTVSNTSALPSGPTVADSQADNKMECSLRWRQGKLWVNSIVRGQDIPLPALAHGDWFLACLTRSRATAVCIDPSLGTEVISLWAQACQTAQKPLFVRIPASPHRPANQKPWAWAVKRGCDRVAALLLLVVLSPLLLLVAGLVKTQGNGPLLSAEWRVGQRGQMFQLLKFRTAANTPLCLTNNLGIVVRPTDLPTTAMGRWLKRSHLDKLPLLVNVLRGDMSLVGPHAWAIYETLALPPVLRTRLHTLPGITGTVRRFAYFPTANSKLVVKELQELRQWSLWKDLKQLTTTMLQVLG